MRSRPALLFYCQHSLGLGHLVRSLALAEGLARHFRVTLVTGGRLPRPFAPPRDVEVVPLPALALRPGGGLVSGDRRRSVERAQHLRRERLLELFRSLRPAVFLVELFPFGRKRFAPELVPVLEEARAAGTLVACSLRDILVGRREQEEHDETASVRAGRYFDAVLVHADPRFARLEDSFRPRTPLRAPVYYTGFVVRATEAAGPAGAQPGPVVVSAGGGVVGEPLLRTAVEAHRLLDRGTPITVVAGPLLPVGAWRELRAAAAGRPGLVLRRSVPDLAGQLTSAAASISQCGYNTALDVLRARVPALVVPFVAEGEDEQLRRARRLARLGAVRVLEPDRLDPPTLAAEVRALRRFRPRPVRLSFDGVDTTTRLLAELCGAAPQRETVAR